jgi:hypothetical protein
MEINIEKVKLSNLVKNKKLKFKITVGETKIITKIIDNNNFNEKIYFKLSNEIKKVLLVEIIDNKDN